MLRRLARDGAMEQAAAERAFRTIAEQSDKLARLLDQLFDLSRLGTGTLTIAPGPTDQHE
jgi:signal transduction histidine kinase